MRRLAIIAMSICAVAAMARPAQASVVYVDRSATGSNTGASWSNAFNDLKVALAAAAPGDQIWVASNTYKPAGVGGNPALAFQLHNSVSLYGGFVGGEALLIQRDWVAHPTVLSGDLNGDDGPNFSNYSDNSYAVVSGAGVDGTAVIDGFIVRSGSQCGMQNAAGSPTIADCTFEANTGGDGGGMSNASSSPVVSHCTFLGNVAALSGGGMFNIASSPVISNCVFVGNTAAQGGGGLEMNQNCYPVIVACSFENNSSDYGGGVHVQDNSAPTIVNCRFVNNTATTGGAGMSALLTCSPHVINCTFSHNNGGPAGAVYDDGGGISQYVNCIVYGNVGVPFAGASSLNVSYSCVQGGYPGAHNTGADPLFVNSATGDVHLSAGSPLIDGGDNTAIPPGVTTDLAGAPRFVDDLFTPDTGNGTAPIVDMGAYEYDPPHPTVYCTAKTNSQGCVPTIGYTGLPSLSGPDNFYVTASNVLNNKSGIMLWGGGQASTPFFGGTLCIAPPLVRTPIQSSGGNAPPNDCSGTYSYHFTQGYMASEFLVAGTSVYAQYWSRDSGFAIPNNIGLTDALHFVISP